MLPEPESLIAHAEATGHPVLSDGNDQRQNNIIIYGESLKKIDDLLRQNSHLIHHAKLHSGSCTRRPESEIKEFVTICKQHGVIPYLGGGLTETAMRRGRLSAFSQRLSALGIDTIEVSNSSGDLPAHAYAETLRTLRKDFSRLLVEIGTKQGDTYKSRDNWTKDLDAALSANATHIILEGAGSGDCGVYDDNQLPNTLLVTHLVERAGEHAHSFVVEAPEQRQQKHWIQELFGWKVRLGNILADSAELKNIERMRDEAGKQAADIDEKRKVIQRSLRNLMELCDEHSINSSRAIFRPELQGLTASSIGDPEIWICKIKRLLCKHPSISQHGSIMVVEFGASDNLDENLRKLGI